VRQLGQFIVSPLDGAFRTAKDLGHVLRAAVPQTLGLKCDKSPLIFL
jgi:hypothetical protein